MRIIKQITILLLLFVSLSNSFASKKNFPVAQKGVLDLSDWNFEEKGILNLDGEWEMYWQQFIQPSEFYNLDTSDVTMYYKVPDLWNGKIINGKKVTGNGYATFRLKIILPDSEDQYACIIGRIETAYKLWINGKEYISKGKLGKTRNEMKPQWNPTTFHFKTDTNVAEIVLQVSNFYHRKGGISNPIKLGNPTQIARMHTRKTGFELFILGILLIMAMHHFALFILRTKERSPLYFGLFCFLTGMHLLVNGQIQLTTIFPGIPWEIILKMNFIGNYLRVPSFTLFIGSLFKKEISNIFVKSISILFAALTLLILVTSARIFTHTLIPVELTILITIGYLIYILFKAAFRKQTIAVVSLIGLFVILAAAINDMLHENMIIQTMYLVPFGIFIFIFFQSFMLSFFSSKAYKSIESLTGRLMKLDKIKNEFLSSSTYSLSNPLKILMENIGVDKGYLLIKKNGKWMIEAKKVFPDLEAKGGMNIELDLTGGRVDKPMISDKIVKQVIKSRENILVNDPIGDEKYAEDEYIVENKPKSIYCMPLVYRTKLKGILYLEMDGSGTDFTEEQIRILDLLSSQVATLIDNAEIFWELETLNKNLERKVEERTQEIILQKEEILAQRDEIEDKSRILEQAYNEIAIKNRDITDSINYAKRIQTSVLPPSTFIEEIVPESFILFKPKDILSGDFYWVEKFTSQISGQILDKFKPEYIVAAAVDCTGHGVPGALLSIMGHNLINNIITEYKYTKPSDILDILQKGVRNYLRQSDDDMKSKDGMDMALISYEKTSKKLQYAGARNPLYLIRNGELIIIKGDRQSIGGFIAKKYRDKKFTNHEIDIRENDIVYIFSDGYFDQFGGPDNLKFSSFAFGNLLISIHKKSLEEQKEILIETLENWKGGGKQIDDILVMAFKFSSIK